MHLHLCCIIVLAFLTPLETRKTCDECSFPIQMKGQCDWRLRSSTSHLVMRRLGRSECEIDLGENLIRFYPPSDASNEDDEFIYDMDENLLYRMMNSSDDCKYVKLHPKFKIPSCVPSDFKETDYMSKGFLYVSNRPDDGDEFLFEKDATCQPTTIKKQQDWNSTVEATMWYMIQHYKLPNDVLQSPFFPNTSVCTETNIDLLLYTSPISKIT